MPLINVDHFNIIDPFLFGTFFKLWTSSFSQMSLEVYNIKNNGRKKILVLGNTGDGKSTLCNVFSGFDPHHQAVFPVSAGANSCTQVNERYRVRLLLSYVYRINRYFYFLRDLWVSLIVSFLGQYVLLISTYTENLIRLIVRGRANRGSSK